MNREPDSFSSKKFFKILLVSCLIIVVLGCVVLSGIYWDYQRNKNKPQYATDKPVLYLYPTEKTVVDVRLDYNGRLTFTYPEYRDGWRVTAYPDGRLICDGEEYAYLFWEGKTDVELDFSKGFVVKGEDTVAFLREKLAYMGLLPREYNDFITYWAPKMQENAYNLITFQWSAYNDIAVLKITPEPDSVLRVFMAYKPLEKPVEIEEPPLPTFERRGFTVVEWGGTCVEK